MRLTRTNPKDLGRRILAGQADDWYDVGSLPGFEPTASLSELLAPARLTELADRLGSAPGRARTAPPDPGTAATIIDADTAVWGAGLNYQRHRDDLEADVPRSGPGSYLRPAGCVIGNGDTIELPTQSGRVTAEAELGLVIGAESKNVHRKDWRSAVAGVTTVLDMTAEDIIRENPRYIPWAKGFDTFCSIGPTLITLDEFDDLTDIRVATVRNGETVAESPTSGMMYDIGYLVEYFTAGRTLRPGTVICTGTPGAAVIADGDTVQAVVDGVGILTHDVAKCT